MRARQDGRGWPMHVMVTSACVWALMTAGCGGGGGGGASEAKASASSSSALNADPVATSLDAYPVNTATDSVNPAAEGYYPLNQGDSWVYDDTVGSDTTVGGLTRSVVSGPNTDGHVVLQEQEDKSTGTEHYTVSSAGVAQDDPLEVASVLPGLYQGFPSWILLPNEQQRTGETRTSDASGDTGADLDNDGKTDGYLLHTEAVFKGIKTINVLGSPTQVAHFVFTMVLELKYSTDGSTRKLTIVQSDAYAKGLGLVQTERVVVQDGKETARQLLVLRAAKVGGVDHGVANGHLDQASITQILPSLGPVSPDTYNASITLTLDEPNAFVSVTSTKNALNAVTTSTVSSTRTRIDLQFQSPTSIGSGTFNDTLTITACVDRACELPVTGSPFVVPVTAIAGLSQAPESGVPALKPLSQQSLTHDVVAAKYSRALDRIVMVSSTPDNRLYVMDPATGVEKSLPLSLAPTSLALSPDGTEAAVGHNWLVTWVKLDSVGQSQPQFKELNFTGTAFEVAMTNAHRVYVSPLADSHQWTDLVYLDVATNTQGTNNPTGPIYAGDTIVARPDGSGVYTQFQHLSSATLHAWSLPDGIPTYVGASDPVAFGESLCAGDLFFANDGQRLLTACGMILNTAPGSNRDMTYNASIPLTNQGKGSSAYRVIDTSQDPATGQWAVLEYAWYDCGVNKSAPDYAGCYHHLNLYSDQSFNLKEKWALEPRAQAGLAYNQEGVAVFYSSNGQHLYLITRLVRMSNLAAAYSLQVIR